MEDHLNDGKEVPDGPGALTAEFVFVEHLAALSTQVMTLKSVSVPFQINFILNTMKWQ